MEYFNSGKELISYLNTYGEDDEHKINILSGERITDDTAVYLLKVVSDNAGIDDFGECNMEEKRKVIGMLHQKYNLPIRQISRITGVGYRVVKKYATDGDGPVALRGDVTDGDSPVAFHGDVTDGDGPVALQYK